MTRLPVDPPTQLPDKIATVLHEARWLVVAALGGYLAMTLWGFSLNDPGWSHAARYEAIVNPGGRFGAWLADLLFYLFGFSAWWLAVLLLFTVIRGSRSIGFAHVISSDRRPLLIALVGFVVLLTASSGIEAMRFWTSKIPLPMEPGGLLGYEVGRFATVFLGPIGGTLILLSLWLAGLSLFLGLSLFQLAEKTGALLEAVWLGMVSLREYWQDRRYGRALAEKRKTVLESERRRFDANPPLPLLIETAEIEIPVARRAEIRADKERQVPMFFDAPGGTLPPLHLLDAPIHQPENIPSIETLEFTSRLIERKLADFGIEVKVVSALPGPVITRYEIDPATGVKGATIVGLAKDLARALSLISIRVVETVPGKSCMALELPNPRRQMVRLSEIIESKIYHDMHSPLTVVLGKDIAGGPVVADLAKMPHLLVAGTTGSGKSVGVNAMILSLVYKSEPSEVRLIMIDPKMLELSIYDGIPHLLAPVVTDMTKAANALHWCVGEMERRYKLLSAMGVRNLAGFNNKIREAAKTGEHVPNPFPLLPESPEPLTTLPHIVVIIDELADLMMVIGKKVEELIARLAQKARAAGIHLILATQRPSVDVITGLIKANIPTRIAFQVSSKIDSRTILDQMGAEALLGQGDMLYMAPGTGVPTRVHGAFVSDEEVHRIVDHLRKVGPPDYVHDILNTPPTVSAESGDTASDNAEADPMYDQAVEVVLKNRRPSISLVQRHLRIGYNRAARLIEAMEKSGLVSSANGAGNREVLVPAQAE
ncbi:MAG: DNA translocase FtsK 4TM domain-containing protein [Rhodocyclaceae bacterium]|nr:DNA translocase FtsK 4TM domain-containing protein [Rhodocyclaceae bacterium]